MVAQRKVFQDYWRHSVLTLLVDAWWEWVLVEGHKLLLKVQLPALGAICMSTEVHEHGLVLETADVAHGLWGFELRGCARDELNQLMVCVVCVNELDDKFLFPATGLKVQ